MGAEYQTGNEWDDVPLDPPEIVRGPGTPKTLPDETPIGKSPFDAQKDAADDKTKGGVAPGSGDSPWG